MAVPVKLLTVDDISRILGRKVTLEPPDIVLYTVTSRGNLVASGPYSRVDNVNDQLVQLVIETNFFWESAANLIDLLFRSLAKRPNREIPLPRTPPQLPRPAEPLPRPVPRKGLPPEQTMEYIPPVTAKDQARVILRRR